ncbi:hypothetical protein SLEP1_g40903 [Rubroshorea leprosula]|uniref:Uncharacterized protein n=1 Tax=Rubroshorea leprosula TaxID=152421 RepID=A0AAV5L5R3_9ROSI|nr:hypothetical protein SLEP1_g40903 [Rubroshorea leprosula]
MASIKTTIILGILCLVLLHEFESMNMAGADGKIDCKSKCDYRCSKASRHKMCIRACNTCCQRCNCVPRGLQATKTFALATQT